MGKLVAVTSFRNIRQSTKPAYIIMAKTSKIIVLLGAFALGVAVQSAIAQDSGPLLDLLVKKGTITDQEAEDLRAALLKQNTDAAAGSLNVTNPGLSSMRLWGDIRVRMEDREATQTSPPNDHIELDRFRYRLRLGFDGTLSDDWSFGLRIDTNSNDRSSNVTLGTNKSTSFGPWSKGDDAINIGQVFASYKPGDWTFTVGKMPLPLTTTNMVWYQDMAPEGLNEQFKHSAGALDYKVDLAQFIYGAPPTGINNNFGTATVSSRDILMLAWQVSLKYNVNKTDYVQISPVLYTYVNANLGNANPAPFNGVFSAPIPASPTLSAISQQAVNNLNVIEIPLEYDTMNLAPKVVRFFGDFGLNTEATARADHYSRPDLSGQSIAYQAGIQYGKATKAGEWDAKAYWQQIDLFALDPNLIDPDNFDSLTNLKGWVVNGNYYLTDAVSLGSTLSHAIRADDHAPTGGDSQDTGSPNLILRNYWLYQFDLNIKF